MLPRAFRASPLRPGGVLKREDEHDRRPWAARLGVAVATLAIAGAVVILAPTLTWWQWIARLVLRETSLGVSAAAAVALVLLRGHPGPARRGRCLGSLLACIVGLLPFVGAGLTFKPPAGSGFSLAQYVTFGRPLPVVGIDRDVVLDPARPSLTSDIYHGAGPSPRPLVVAIHGGSWRGGDKGQGDHAWRYLAAAGYTVVDVRYGLAPEHPFPQAIGDVKCLLGRLREQAGHLGVDGRHAALLGRSAGGQIALIAAYTPGDGRLPPSCGVEDLPVQAVVSLYGPTDLVWGYRNPTVPDVIDGNESLRLYLGGSPEEQPESYRLGSALSWADRALPPTLLIHGLGDQLVRAFHSTNLAEGLRRAGHPVELLEIPFAEHGFDVRAGGVGEQIARQTVSRFLARPLSLPAVP